MGEGEESGETFSPNMDLKNSYLEGHLSSGLQVLEIIKYDGGGCSHTHLWTYCNEMFQLGEDEGLFIHLFSQSLEGYALRWFINLEKNKLWTCKKLSKVFLKHIKSNLDFLPLKSSLQKIRLEPYEYIREYTFR